MAVLKVYDLDKKEVGEIQASDRVFDCEVNRNLFYEVVKMQLANRRLGLACTKTRADVTGSSAKMFRQKGTGRARRGARRTPSAVGGGTAFGPKPHSFSYKVPRKVRSGALRSAISLRNKEGKLVILENFEMDEFKTKFVTDVLGRFEMVKPLIIEVNNEKLFRSARNIKGTDVLPVSGLNVFDILNHDELVLTRQAVEMIEERLK